MNEDDAFYVCLPVQEGEQPLVPSHIGTCFNCKRKIWYSKFVYERDKNIRKLVDTDRAICVDCALGKVK